MFFLSPVDPVVLESVGPGTGRSWTCLEDSFGLALFPAGYHEQTFHCDVTSCAGLMLLVAQTQVELERPRSIGAVFSDLRCCQCMDDLGTRGSCWRQWTGMDPDMAGTHHHCRTRNVVLSRHTSLSA